MLSVINTIASFCQSKTENFDSFLEQLNKAKEKKIITKEVSESKLLTKKRGITDSISMLQADIKEMNKKIKENKNNVTQSSVKPKEIEGEMFKSISEIISTFRTDFPDKTMDQILEVLKSTSVNMYNAHLYFKDPTTFKSKIYF